MPIKIVWSSSNVSKYERVLSEKSTRDERGCAVWKASSLKGYGQVSFFGKAGKAHRWAYMLAMRLTEIPKGQEVRHLCGNSLCVNSDHLTLGTSSENKNDRIAHGTSAHGRNSKTSVDTVRTIKKTRKEHPELTIAELASLLGLPYGTVRIVDSGESWAWVGTTEEEDDKTVPCARVRRESNKRKRELREWTSEDFQEGREYLEKKSALNETSHPGCVQWTGRLDREGYGESYFKTKSLGAKKAHVLSYIVHNEKTVPKGEFVLHQCVRNRSCVNHLHLRTGTAKDNAHDRRRDGTQQLGEAHHSRKLTEDAVYEIRRDAKRLKGVELAKLYGVSTATISKVIRNEGWKHV